MVPPSKEYLEKSKKFDELCEPWLIYNPEIGNVELKKGTPKEIVELDKWLKDNYPAKDFPFKD